MKTNHFKSKIGGVVLLLLISTNIFSVSAQTLIGDIYYNLDYETHTAEVVMKSSEKSGALVIPDKVSFEGTTYIVTSIKSFAFSGCSGLTSVVISETVTCIGDYAFHKCYNLDSIIVDAGNTVYDSRANCNAIIETATNTLIKGCRNTIIPNTVNTIGKYAFWGLTDLTSIEIPNSVSNIEVGAFEGCKGLLTLNIPNSVIVIGNSAFSYCYGLKSVNLSNSVKRIEGFAFCDCISLTSIVIPISVDTIFCDAFAGCRALSSITVSEDNIKYDSRNNCNAIIETATNKLISGCMNTVIPNMVTGIGSRAFTRHSGLKSIVIPETVTNIGTEAFSGCRGLTSIIIPNSLSRIDYGTFYQCSNLAYVVIGASVTQIGQYAFYSCSSLQEIYMKSATPPVKTDYFYGCDQLSTIYVPLGSKRSYEAKSPWNSYEIVEIDYSTDIKPLMLSDIKDNEAMEVYELNGRRVGKVGNLNSLPKGAYIVNGKKILK